MEEYKTPFHNDDDDDDQENGETGLILDTPSLYVHHSHCCDYFHGFLLQMTMMMMMMKTRLLRLQE